MGNAANNKKLDQETRREAQRAQERETWQKEFIARQEFMKHQVEHRKELRKVPKAAWIFMAGWGGIFVIACLLFLMSFNPATSEFVNKVLGSFKVF